MLSRGLVSSRILKHLVLYASLRDLVAQSDSSTRFMTLDSLLASVSHRIGGSTSSCGWIDTEFRATGLRQLSRSMDLVHRDSGSISTSVLLSGKVRVVIENSSRCYSYRLLLGLGNSRLTVISLLLRNI